ncbi:MAG: hypothetical protein AAF367_14005 [Pseudomonadota bacterium]
MSGALTGQIGGMFGLARLGIIGGILASLLALVTGWLVHWLGGFPAVIALTLAAFVLAHRASRIGDVALDCFAGQLLALWALSGGLWFAGVAPHIFPWPGVVGSFVIFTLFRFLPPMRALRRRGAIFDDMAAGATAAAVTLLSAAISHGWIG